MTKGKTDNVFTPWGVLHLGAITSSTGGNQMIIKTMAELGRHIDEGTNLQWRTGARGWLRILPEMLVLGDLQAKVLEGRIRVEPGPLRLTVMYMRSPQYSSGFHVLLKENDSPDMDWSGWTKATIGENGKLMIEVDDENI